MLHPAAVTPSEIIQRLCASDPLPLEETAPLFDGFLTLFFQQCAHNLTNTSTHYSEALFLHTLFPGETISTSHLHAMCLTHKKILITRYHAEDNPLHQESLLRLCHYVLSDTNDTHPIPDQFLHFVLDTYPDTMPYRAPLQWTRLNPGQVQTAWTHPCRSRYQPRGRAEDWKYIATATQRHAMFSEVCTAFLTDHRQEVPSILPDALTTEDLDRFEAAIPSPTHYANLWFLDQPHSSSQHQLRALRALGSRKAYAYKTKPICLRFAQAQWMPLNHKQRCQAYIHLAQSAIHGCYPAEALPASETFASSVLKLTFHKTSENQTLLEEYTLQREWITHYRTHGTDPLQWWQRILNQTIDTLNLDNSANLMDHLNQANPWFKEQDEVTQALRGWYLDQLLERIHYRYATISLINSQLTRINHLLTRKPPFLIYPEPH